MSTPGIHLHKRIDKMGMRGSDTAVIYLDDVRIPAKNIIGEPGMGFTYQMLQFQEERLACAALSMQPMDNIIAETIEYLKQRKAFGQPLLNNQYMNVWKNSSLAVVVAYTDIFYVILVMMNNVGKLVPLFLLLLVTYQAGSLTISAIMNWYNSRVTSVKI